MSLNKKFCPARTALELLHGMTVESELHAELMLYRTLAYFLQDTRKCVVLSLRDVNYIKITHKFG